MCTRAHTILFRTLSLIARIYWSLSRRFCSTMQSPTHPSLPIPSIHFAAAHRPRTRAQLKRAIDGCLNAPQKANLSHTSQAPTNRGKGQVKRRRDEPHGTLFRCARLCVKIRLKPFLTHVDHACFRSQNRIIYKNLSA